MVVKITSFHDVHNKINLYLGALSDIYTFRIDGFMDDLIPLDFVSTAILFTGSVLGKTWRVTVSGTKLIDPFTDRDKGIIYCFWHSHILPLTYIFRNIGVKAVVSSSKDGDRATAVAQRWQHQTIRGSSSLHGVSALRQCVRELKRRQNIVLIPDGPRGPREIVKPGVAQIALLSDAAVFPVIALPVHAWRLNSWDRFMVPKPFTTIDVRIAGPLYPSQFIKADDPVASFTSEIQKALTV
jgi:Uncharacterized protein conserved in bacteria